MAASRTKLDAAVFRTPTGLVAIAEVGMSLSAVPSSFSHQDRVTVVPCVTPPSFASPVTPFLAFRQMWPSL